MLKGLIPALIIAFLFQSLIVYSQKGDLIVKWNATRIINPFNSTFQIGAEYFLLENKSIEVEIGIKFPILKDYSRYDKGVFIARTQFRQYKDNDFFEGVDFFYLHAKDYSDFRCLYNKNKKYTADYDSVTLVKNSFGIAYSLGYQIKAGKISFDFYTGLGLRLVNNYVRSARETIRTENCFRTHYDWGNDNNRGTFIGGHFLGGIKIGYLFSKE